MAPAINTPTDGKKSIVVQPYAFRKVHDGVVYHALGWHVENLSMFEFRLVIDGAPAVLKNSKQIVTLPGRRPLLVSSQQAKKYLKSATEQLREEWGDVFSGPIHSDVFVNASIVVFLPNHRKTDLSNQYEGPQDALVASGVLVDDFQIASHDGSRRLYDPDNPRVEITLTPYVEDPMQAYLRAPCSVTKERSDT